MKNLKSCNGAILFGKTEIIKRFFEFTDEESKQFNTLQMSLELVIGKVSYSVSIPFYFSNSKKIFSGR